jgi:hypothetical protein
MLSHALSQLLISHRANTTKQLVDGVCTAISLLVGFIFIRCSRHQEMEDINHCMFDGVGVLQQLVNLWGETGLGLLLSLPPGRSTASSSVRASRRAPKRACRVQERNREATTYMYLHTHDCNRPQIMWPQAQGKRKGDHQQTEPEARITRHQDEEEKEKASIG